MRLVLGIILGLSVLLFWHLSDWFWALNSTEKVWLGTLMVVFMLISRLFANQVNGGAGRVAANFALGIISTLLVAIISLAGLKSNPMVSYLNGLFPAHENMIIATTIYVAFYTSSFFFTLKKKKDKKEDDEEGN